MTTPINKEQQEWAIIVKLLDLGTHFSPFHSPSTMERIISKNFTVVTTTFFETFRVAQE